MPPGVNANEMPTLETQDGQTGELGGFGGQEDQTPRARPSPEAIPIYTPAPADQAVPSGPATPEPVPARKRATSASPPPDRRRGASPPRTKPDPWAQARAPDAGQTLAHVNALMASMQKTIEMLSQQLADIKAEKADKHKDKDKEDGMPTMHYKDIDKPSKFSGHAWSTWSTDFVSFLGRKEQGIRWKKIPMTIQSISQKPLDANGHKKIS